MYLYTFIIYDILLKYKIVGVHCPIKITSLQSVIFNTHEERVHYEKFKTAAARPFQRYVQEGATLNQCTRRQRKCV